MPRGIYERGGEIVRSLPLLREIEAQFPNGTQEYITWLLDEGIVTFPERCIRCELGDNTLKNPIKWKQMEAWAPL